MAPISLIRRQHVWDHMATYFCNSLPFYIKINRLVEWAHESNSSPLAVPKVNIHNRLAMQIKWKLAEIDRKAKEDAFMSYISDILSLS